MALQIPLRTQSSAEAYIANRGWRDASMLACPLHPSGGCSFARHGSYARVTPRGLRVARWYCPQGHRTFSLLPDFLAARMPGLLASIEDAVVAVASAKSMRDAADALRGFDVSLPSALRWLRRRVRAVETALDAVSRMVPTTAVTVLAGRSALEPDLGQGEVLRGLRRSLSPPLLNSLPTPVGFAPRCAKKWSEGNQHEMGPDRELAVRYGTGTDVTPAPCDLSPPSQCQQLPRPPPSTCFVSGAPTAVYRTAVPARTSSGSEGSERIACSASWWSGPN